MMFDPLTVAFEIKYPWRKYKPGDKQFPDGYRDTFITVWHDDPQTGGMDDSCGFEYPRIPKDLQDRIMQEVAIESQTQEFYRVESEIETFMDEGEEVSVVREKWFPKFSLEFMIESVYLFLLWRLFKKHLLLGDIQKICYLKSNPGDSFQYFVDLSLGQGEVTYLQRSDIESFYFCVVRQILYVRRKWWRHPKWHIHHWKLQIHPLQKLRRFLFSRCDVCGGRFKWGEIVYSQAPKRRWQGERTVRHDHCTAVETENE